MLENASVFCSPGTKSCSILKDKGVPVQANGATEAFLLLDNGEFVPCAAVKPDAWSSAQGLGPFDGQNWALAQPWF